MPSPELTALPRAAVVVEDRYSRVFELARVWGALAADGPAELQVRWPNVPIVFCEACPLAGEWTYRFVSAGERASKSLTLWWSGAGSNRRLPLFRNPIAP